MNSFKDAKDILWVACSECERGGNGSDEDKCSCGGTCKKFKRTGCFSGGLMEKHKEELSK